MKIWVEIEDCKHCPFVECLPDPDPHDWFCSNDTKYVCAAANNKVIDRCYRPYQKITIPKWCPKGTNGKV